MNAEITSTERLEILDSVRISMVVFSKKIVFKVQWKNVSPRSFGQACPLRRAVSLRLKRVLGEGPC